jgi:hypothetical protein
MNDPLGAFYGMTWTTLVVLTLVYAPIWLWLKHYVMTRVFMKLFGQIQDLNACSKVQLPKLSEEDMEIPIPTWALLQDSAPGFQDMRPICIWSPLEYASEQQIKHFLRLRLKTEPNFSSIEELKLAAVREACLMKAELSEYQLVYYLDEAFKGSKTVEWTPAPDLWLGWKGWWLEIGHGKQLFLISIFLMSISYLISAICSLIYLLDRSQTDAFRMGIYLDIAHMFWMTIPVIVSYFTKRNYSFCSTMKTQFKYALIHHLACLGLYAIAILIAADPAYVSFLMFGLLGITGVPALLIIVIGSSPMQYEATNYFLIYAPYFICNAIIRWLLWPWLLYKGISIGFAHSIVAGISSIVVYGLLTLFILWTVIPLTYGMKTSYQDWRNESKARNTFKRI